MLKKHNVSLITSYNIQISKELMSIIFKKKANDWHYSGFL